jgi:hypothetical protein
VPKSTGGIYIEIMSDTTIQHLFRSLEHTVRERLDGIQEVIQNTRGRSAPGNVTYTPHQDTEMLLRRIQELEGQNQGLLAMFQVMKGEIAALRDSCSSRDILPLHPIQGIEVIPKREVVITEEEPPAYAELSYPDRLLLNKKARKALEAEEMGESNEKPLLDEAEAEAEAEAEEEEVEVEEEVEEEVEAEVEEEIEEEVEEEVEAEAEAEAEEEAVELEEFEYKGSTYYRDGENNVFMTDEDGELLDTPIGTWNEVKQRIVTSKA